MREASNRLDTTSMPEPALVFVYNADAGIFNALADLAHKTFAPETYACNLCALTYGTFGMRAEWKRFLQTLGRPLEFLHADELREQTGLVDAELPAIFEREGAGLRLLVDRERIEACRTLADLENILLEQVSRRR